METTKQQEGLLEQLGELVKLHRALPGRESVTTIELLKSFGITRLALWSAFFKDFEEEPIAYNEEDKELFGELKPDFWLEPDFMQNEDTCCGQAFAVEISDDGRLNVVLCDTLHDEVYSTPLSYVFHLLEEEVFDAVFKSIQFNLDNNIPVEKWAIAHYSYVDPYTYEYLGC